MADKPILFSGPMVRALIAGTKTQTRRVFKGVEEVRPGYFHVFGSGGGIFCDGEAEVKHWGPSYLRISEGDRLYVRETIRAEWPEDVHSVRYAADQFLHPTSDERWEALPKGRSIPGIHQPRWASRLTLTVTDVRVERLQDISDADAVAEGTPCYVCGGPMDGRSEADCHCFHRKADATDYRNLWEAINGAGTWAANPWVAAYSFTVQMGNIDQLAEAA